jgi:thiol:disulfide interchange protein DsbA
MISRRAFFLAAASSISIPVFALNGQDGFPEPFRELKPQIFGENNKVHAVIAFTCPVCANYHMAITGWGNTLPKQFSFDFLSHVSDQNSAVLARAWIAMSRVDKQKLPFLASAFFTLVQQQGLSPQTAGAEFWKLTKSMIGPVPGFSEAFQRVTAEDLMLNQRKIAAFGIDATPSLVIGGKYVVTPDNTGGNNELFFQLANGMVSKLI